MTNEDEGLGFRESECGW